MKRRIQTFSGFVNEQKKLNEGGGAGVNFIIDKVSFSASYEITKNSIKVLDVSSSMSDTFSASGYDDGMSDVGSWLLKIDTTKANKPDRKWFENISIDFNNRYDLLTDINDSDITDAGIDEEKFNTISDIFETWPDAVLIVSFDLSKNDWNEMHFAGWSRGKLEENDIIFDSSNFDPEGTINIAAKGQDEYDLDWDNDIITNIGPNIIASKEFNSFWNDVFQNQDENYRAYVKDELINKITEDEFDEELEEYLDDVDSDNMPNSIEDMKGNIKKYIDAFSDYWLDKNYEYFWDTFLSGIKDDYSAENAPEE